MGSDARWLVLLTLLCGLWSTHAKFRCHNFCNGHGTCTEYNYCECSLGWQGVDCRERTCDMGRAWVDKPWDVDTAHYYAECSNQGLCNRKTGVCDCFAGFTGPACQKATCGTTNCNGHGACITMNQANQMYTSYKKSVEYYHSWEVNHVTMCQCEYGYGGADCSYKLCPKGDDPNSASTGHRAIKMIVDVQPRATGQFRFTFNGQSFSFPGRAELWRDEECKSSFESLPNIATVNCTSRRLSSRTIEYSIEFLKFPTWPYENSLFTNDGNPPLSSFYCDTSRVTNSRKVYCELYDLVTSSDVTLPEYTFCSNRGICNFDTGLCKCLSGFSNANCDTYDARSVDTVSSVNSDVLHIVTENSDFRKSVLRLHSTTEASSDVKFLQLVTLSGTIFEIDGNGNLNLNYGGISVNANNNSVGGQHIKGGLTVRGGQSISAGGLTSSYRVNLTSGAAIDGGLRVNKGGALISQGLDSLVLTQLYQQGLRIKSDGGVLVYAGGATISNGGLSVFEGVNVTSGGVGVLKKGMTIYDHGLNLRGGLMLTGNTGFESSTGITISSGGFAATSGVTINSDGLMAFTDGLTVRSSGIVSGLPVTIFSAGAIITGGLTVTTTDLQVSGGMTILSDGFYAAQGISVTTTGISIPQIGLGISSVGITASDLGVVVQGGLTIEAGSMLLLRTAVTPRGIMVSGGLRDQYEGLVVSAVGLQVTGGITISSGAVGVQGGASCQGGLMVNNGVRINGGFNVYKGFSFDASSPYVNDGASISGGTSILSSGLYASQGLMIQQTGLIVSGGLTISNLGLKITGGATVESGGIVITNGLTVSDTGMSVSGGIYSATSGLLVTTSGLSMGSTGIVAKNGLTILVQHMVSPSLTVNNAGIYIKAGMTIRSAGLYIATSGLTVSLGGMFVTNGLTVYNNLRGLSTMSISGGFTFSSGLTITSPGLVTDSLVLTTSYLSTANAVSIYNSGVNTPALSCENNGITVRSGGVTINTGGMIVSNGITITGGALFSGGLRPTSRVNIGTGLTVNDGGMYVKNSVNVENSGAVVPKIDIQNFGLILTTSGMSVDGGWSNIDTVSINNGATSDAAVALNKGDLIVANSIRNVGGLFLTSNGMTTSAASVVGGSRIIGGGIVYGGVRTLDASGMTLKSGGITIKTRGLKVTGSTPVTVLSDGVIVTGDMTVFGGMAIQNAYTTSDENLKTNIVRLEDSVKRVSKLKGVYYSLKKNFFPSASGKEVGVIAQDVLSVLPEAVRSDGQYLRVQYDSLIPLVVNAVQELATAYDDEKLALQNCSCESSLRHKLHTVGTRLIELEQRNAIMRSKAVELLTARGYNFS